MGLRATEGDVNQACSLRATQKAAATVNRIEEHGEAFTALGTVHGKDFDSGHLRGGEGIA
jgi:hypothetical protein